MIFQGVVVVKLLRPLGKSQYTITSTHDFIRKWKDKQVPAGYQLVSFDVVSLFTNVPLNKTIDIILRRIYEDNAIHTNIPCSDLKQLLLLCTKNVHFTYENETYIQTDGVAMGSPLGSILADICMVDLEETLLPTLTEHIQDWSRYVDDTIGIVKNDSIDHIINTLNSFHPNIQFTHETETANKINFLDVMIIRNNNTLSTTIYRKPTNNDIYIHWNAFAPETWKRGTLRTLTQRAYTVCSNEKLLTEELLYLRRSFNNVNGYPHHIITKIFQSVKHNHITLNLTITPTPPTTPTLSTTPNLPTTPSIQEDNTTPNINLLILPYKGKPGETILKDLKRSINPILPPSVDTKICFTSTKLSSKFSFKDKTQTKHEHNIVYMVECPDQTCSSTYIGETAWRLHERVTDHSGRDKNSHLLKHAIETGHPTTSIEHFKIIGRNYRNGWGRKLE